MILGICLIEIEFIVYNLAFQNIKVHFILLYYLNIIINTNYSG